MTEQAQFNYVVSEIKNHNCGDPTAVVRLALYFDVIDPLGAAKIVTEKSTLRDRDFLKTKEQVDRICEAEGIKVSLK